jgi:hypothetical protein
MDLGAYMQIEDIEKIANDNEIEVPRLRGYRLMKNEKPVNISKMVVKNDIAIECVKNLCESQPFWNVNADWNQISSWTDIIKEFYLVVGRDKDGYKEYTDIRWDRIHGWKRKVLKTYIHNEIKRQSKQWELWNKYAGRNDILYIHARIGGKNWRRYHDQVDTKPWFLEKVDDSFDSTYCDIYAKIKEE